jgi:hypothetical protein
VFNSTRIDSNTSAGATGTTVSLTETPPAVKDKTNKRKSNILVGACMPAKMPNCPKKSKLDLEVSVINYTIIYYFIHA